MSEVFNKDHIYTMLEKRNLHNQPTRILEKYLVKAIHKQIHKYIKTSKSASFRRISGKVWIIGFWGIPGRVGVTF